MASGSAAEVAAKLDGKAAAVVDEGADDGGLASRLATTWTSRSVDPPPPPAPPPLRRERPRSSAAGKAVVSRSIALAGFLRSPGGRPNLHGSDPWEPAPLGPAFALRGCDRTGGGDGVQVGFMDEPPGTSLCRRHGLQVGQIGAAVPAHLAGVRAGQGVEPGGAEQAPADAAKSMSRKHM
jgi:hypothetical protein